jgi:hypothetical protein
LQRQSRATPASERPTGAPPAERTFNLTLPRTTLPARLAAVGRYCQIYVDTVHTGELSATVADIVRGFDERILPAARQLLGQAADVDGDGRFTILLTPQLPAGLGGYVDRQDFAAGGCDRMVLSTALQPGEHLQALLAHEYTHAVVYGGGRPEEDWLNEGLAHTAEEALGFGWTNLDYRVAADCNAPERYPLVVPDHQQAGWYRHPGHRGAAYLFFRHCTRRHGPGLFRQLAQTPLTGVANLEVATGESLADLFRAWGVSLHSGEAMAEQYVARRVDAGRLAQLFEGDAGGERSAISPRHHDLPLTAGQLDLPVAGTGLAHVLLHSPGGRPVRVEVAADPSAGLQVTLLRLPAQQPRLSVRGVATGGGIRLEVTAHDAEAMLESVSVSPRVPAHRGETRRWTARACFPALRLRPGETAASAVLPLPEGAPSIWRVQALGSAGHVVTGWWEREAMADGW